MRKSLLYTSQKIDRGACDEKKVFVPAFVSIVAIVLGCLDLIRGFVHTIVLEYAALNIAGLDLSTPTAADLLRLLVTFGISNYLTGMMLILIGWKARPLALAMLGIIPTAYAIGAAGIRANTAAYAPSQAAWGGGNMMVAYMITCAVTFIAGIIVTQIRKRKGKEIK
jgi:hypothetical protein